MSNTNNIIPRRDLCAYCFDNEVGKKKKCSGCRSFTIKTRYCNETCQRAHWPFHKLTCNYKNVLCYLIFKCNVLYYCIYKEKYESKKVGEKRKR